MKVSEPLMDVMLLDFQKNGMRLNLQAAAVSLGCAVAKANLMLSRKNLREAQSEDEQIDTYTIKSRLETLIQELGEIHDKLETSGV